MDDNELSRKVTDIEFARINTQIIWLDEYGRPHDYPETVPPYATDWAWCGPLIQKYELNLEYWEPGTDEIDSWCAFWSPAAGNFESANTPQRAICKAIISLTGSPL